MLLKSATRFSHSSTNEGNL